MLRDLLRVDLPAASVLTTGNVLTRVYPLILYCNTQARIVRAVLESINYTPVVAKPEIHVLSGGEEYGRYTGADGFIPLRTEWTDFEPLRLRLFNLSIDTPASFTFVFSGQQYEDLPS